MTLEPSAGIVHCTFDPVERTLQLKAGNDYRYGLGAVLDGDCDDRIRRLDSSGQGIVKFSVDGNCVNAPQF